MYYVYVLKIVSNYQSKNNRKLYIGSTDDLERRLKEHQKRKWSFALIYYEAFLSERDAREREKQLKYFGKAYQELKKRIENSLSVKGAG